jgi:hypothetical protein
MLPEFSAIAAHEDNVASAIALAKNASAHRYGEAVS